MVTHMTGNRKFQSPPPKFPKHQLLAYHSPLSQQQRPSQWRWFQLPLLLTQAPVDQYGRYTAILTARLLLRPLSNHHLPHLQQCLNEHQRGRLPSTPYLSVSTKCYEQTAQPGPRSNNNPPSADATTNSLFLT